VTGTTRWRIAAAIWAAFIFISGVVPTQGLVAAVSEGHDDAFTTAAHFAVYVGLGFMLAVALGGWTVSPRRLLLALVLAAALGGAIELVQGPLPYRDTQLSDFLMDVAGAAVGLVAFSAVARGQRTRSHA